MKTLRATPDRLRVSAPARSIGVDREKRVLLGYVVAQAGPFKSEGRGEFDYHSLEQILVLWPKNGLKSRFSHPTESADGLGKFLGRARDPWFGKATTPDGKTVDAVRADLYLDASAFEANPNGNLGEYILTLAESDPAALSSSLVLRKEEEMRLDEHGVPQVDDDGKLLPGLWRPTRLFASDIVDEGDAVDGILSAPVREALSVVDGLRWTRDYLSAGEALLNKLFAGQTRGVVEARLTAYLTRYLDRRFGSSGMANKKLGAAVAGVLETWLADASGGDENARAGLIAQMAEQSGKTVDETIAIIEGESPIDMPTIEAFARVLGGPISELVDAAEQDGEIGGEPEEPAPEEAPADPAAGGDAPPAPMSVKRRKLALQEKAV